MTEFEQQVAEAIKLIVAEADQDAKEMWLASGAPPLSPVTYAGLMTSALAPRVAAAIDAAYQGLTRDARQRALAVLRGKS